MNALSKPMLGLLICSSVCAQPVVQRDVVLVNGQHYLRTQEIASGSGYNAFTSVSAPEGRYVLAYHGGAHPNAVGKFREVNRWHREIVAPIDVAPALTLGVYGLVPAAYNDRSTIMFKGWTGDVILESYDSSGLPLGSPVVFCRDSYVDVTWYQDFRVALTSSHGIAVAIGYTNGPGADDRILQVGALTHEGSLAQAVRSTIILGGSTDPRLACHQDGSALAVYYSPPPMVFVPHRINVARLNSDLSLTSGLSLDIAEGGVNYAIHALADGTYLLITWSPNVGGEARRLDANGQVIGTPKPLGPDYWYHAAAAPDGQFAVVYQGPLRVQVYDSAAEPVGGEFDFSMPTTHPIRHLADIIDGAAYAADGSIALLWTGWGGPTGDNTFLVTLRPFTPGDLNADGSFNNFDIDAFVAALVDRDAYHVAYPDVPLDVIDFLGDMNGDGVLNNFDIDPFVEALVGAP